MPWLGLWFTGVWEAPGPNEGACEVIELRASP